MPRLKDTHQSPSDAEDEAITKAMQEDADASEWTAAESAASRPAAEVLPDLVWRTRYLRAAKDRNQKP